MSYEPTEWKNGDIITSEKLNNIETGVRSMNSEYVPTEWKNGDVITAEKLNNIEQGIVAGSGEEQWETLFDDEITTENDGQINSYDFIIDNVISNDTIKVTFDGTEYTCEKNIVPQANLYGGMTVFGPDFSEYPFAIISGNDGSDNYCQILTESAGTYSLKIEAQESSGSSDFSTAEVEFILQDTLVSFPVAINAIIYGNMECFEGITANETFTIPLYQGCVKLWLSPSENLLNITTTGNVVYDHEEGALIVTGNGTVTVSSEEIGSHLGPINN